MGESMEGNCYPVAYEGIAATDLIREDGVVKCGWLLKKSGNAVRQSCSLLNAYEKRFFVLAKGWVYYYKDKTSSKPQKQFTLEHFSKRVLPAEEEASTCPHVFKIFPSKNKKDGRTWYFGAENDDDMDSWMECFKMEIDRYNPQSNLRGSKSFPGDRKAACTGKPSTTFSTMSLPEGRQRPVSTHGIGEITSHYAEKLLSQRCGSAYTEVSQARVNPLTLSGPSGWTPSSPGGQYEVCPPQPQPPHSTSYLPQHSPPFHLPQHSPQHSTPFHLPQHRSPTHPQQPEQPTYVECDPQLDYDTIDIIPLDSKSAAGNGIPSPRHHTLPISPNHSRQLPSIPTSNSAATLPKQPLAARTSFPMASPPPPPKNSGGYVDVESQPPEFIADEEDNYLQPNLLLQQLRLRNDKSPKTRPTSTLPSFSPTKSPTVPGSNEDNMYYDVEVIPEYDCPDSYTPEEKTPQSSPVAVSKSPRYPAMPALSKSNAEVKPSYLKSSAVATGNSNSSDKPTFASQSNLVSVLKSPKYPTVPKTNAGDVRPSYLKSPSVETANSNTSDKPTFASQSNLVSVLKSPKYPTVPAASKTNAGDVRPSYLKSPSVETGNSNTSDKPTFEKKSSQSNPVAALKSPKHPTVPALSKSNAGDVKPSYLKTSSVETGNSNTSDKPTFASQSNLVSVLKSPKYPTMPAASKTNAGDVRPSYLKSPSVETANSNTSDKPTFEKKSSQPNLVAALKSPKYPTVPKTNAGDVRPSYLKSPSVETANSNTSDKPTFEKKSSQSNPVAALKSPKHPTVPALSKSNAGDVRPSYLKSSPTGSPTNEKKHPQIAARPRNFSQPPKLPSKPTNTTDTTRPSRPSDLKDKSKPSPLINKSPPRVHPKSPSSPQKAQTTEEKRPEAPPKTQAARQKASAYISQHQTQFQQVRNNILKNLPKPTETKETEDESKPASSVMSRMKMFEQSKQPQPTSPVSKKPPPTRKPKPVFPKPT